MKFNLFQFFSFDFDFTRINKILHKFCIFKSKLVYKCINILNVFSAYNSLYYFYVLVLHELCLLILIYFFHNHEPHGEINISN